MLAYGGRCANEGVSPNGGGASDGGSGGLGEVLRAGCVKVAFAAWVVVVWDKWEGPPGEDVFTVYHALTKLKGRNEGGGEKRT